MNYQITLTFDELLHARAGIIMSLKHLWQVRRSSSSIVAANCFNCTIRDQIAAFRALQKYKLV